MATQRTRQSMKNTNTTTDSDVVTEETLESFETLLAEALKDVSADVSLQTEQFGEEDGLEGGDIDVGGDVDIDVGGGDEGGASSIEDLVEQLRDIVDQIAAEVGVGGGDEQEYDDDFSDDQVDDDLDNVPTEAKQSKGHPIKNKGQSLQAKNNKVAGKLNKRGGKAGTTAVHGKHGQVGPAPKSNLTDKGKQKVGGTKTTVNDDLF